MKLDLGEIILHLGKRIRYQIDEPPIKDIEDGIRNIKPIKGEVVFSNAAKHIVVRGHFTTEIEVVCARCLNPYKMDISLPIEEEMLIAGHLPETTEAEAQLPEDAKEPLFEDNILNLTELLRQYIIVAVPIKPLCDEECKGLCSQCGQNLNQEPCNCPPEEGNAAFADLAMLLEQKDEDESKS
ncbi:MAG: DUF177 domain-containing protein [Armatimonadetes bacterium]|nr:DUF177 domain-containing protein [Armatimonadota bacterium]